MRVRHLQTYLRDQKLVRSGKISELRDFRIGFDAVYWTRTLPGLKDPLADALGGLPPAVYGVIDKELQHAKQLNITPIFVFSGLQPRSHQLFSLQMHQQMDDAWHLLAEGDRAAAQNKFAQVTSRINSDFIQFVYLYLRSRECQVFQAPYFATAQLAYFTDLNFFDAVFGPPALLLYGVPKVITGIDFAKGKFESVELHQLLTHWNVSRDQFLDACLMAGTEYCLTFPYLNLPSFHMGSVNFTFGTAIEFIRQAPLTSYMQHFPNEEMKNDHVDGYCYCRALIQHPLVMQLNGVVGSPIQPPNGTAQPLPCDFSKIVGQHLPNAFYYLLVRGFISRKIPSVLASGEWHDYSQPTVDSTEYRDLLADVRGYRARALGLMAMRLHTTFRTKPTKFLRYQCGTTPSEITQCTANCDPGVCWRFTAEDVQRELQRQNVTADNIDFKFCLQWHAHAAETNSEMYRALQTLDGSHSSDPTDLNSLISLVYFQMLENLGYFTDEGAVTVFGTVLLDTPREFEEPCLFVLELMKFGCLSGDPLQAPPDRAFPESIRYVKDAEHLTNNQRSVLFLSRVLSLIPANRKAESWNADVDFDLAAFHCCVKILKRTLRQLTEACLGSSLLKDLTKIRMLPNDYINTGAPPPPGRGTSPSRGGSIPTPQLASFKLPSACMGLIVKFFLQYHVEPGTQCNPQTFHTQLKQAFPCCVSPLADLVVAFSFWDEVMRIFQLLQVNVDVADLTEDMSAADAFLKSQKERLKIMSLAQQAA